jgi:hypothetical protein
MTAAFLNNDIYQIESEAWKHFQCQPLAAGRDIPKRMGKRDKVSRIVEKYFAVMNSDDPPLTKEAAVEMVAPFMTLLLSLFFKQLAVMVIEWLWERTR